MSRELALPQGHVPWLRPWKSVGRRKRRLLACARSGKTTMTVPEMTPTGGLSPCGAQIELALPGNRMRNAVAKIDLEGLRKAGYKIPEPKRVIGRFGRPGGGWEYEFDYDIPARYLIGSDAAGGTVSRADGRVLAGIRARSLRVGRRRQHG